MRTLITLTVCLLAMPSPAWSADTELKPSQVFAIDAPSIVLIKSFDNAGKAIALGSGVVIAKEIVVSNCHVVEKSATASVFYQHKRIAAKLLYADVERDLCAFIVKGLSAPPVRMGATSQVKVGDAAYAIGAPEGLELSLSGGLISSLRNVPDGVVLQMTTPISPGSSGGGLFDSQGRLIGITSYYMAQGEQLNFALPVEWVNELPQRGKLAKANTKNVGYVTNAKDKSALHNGIRAFHSGDYTAALKIFNQLAKDGNVIAQTFLGWMYHHGQGVPKDDVKAAAWFRKAAERGYATAQNNLGVMYKFGEGVPKDNTQAVTWFRKAAQQGGAQAQLNLGVMYNYGQGVQEDFTQAAVWYRKAAEQGNALAQYYLGMMYDLGQGVSQDYVQAMVWYHKAAEQGYAPAQNIIGGLYELGLGVPQDYVQAATWYRKAAAQGNDNAQYRLGSMYDIGQGVSQDYTQAAAWFRKAAEQRNDDAQFSLGFMYYAGQGIQQDYAQAAEWYNKAAEQGNAVAQFDLGLMYFYGQGVQQDYAQAVVLYRKAAEQDNASALNTLGTLYLSGQGVTQDYVVAYALFNLSASIDNTDKGAINRNNVINYMTPAQVEAGQALTREMQRVGVLEALDAYMNSGAQ